MLIFIIATFFRCSCFGLPGDKSLILGVWNPASLTTFKEIPRDSTSSFSNVSIELSRSNLLITSLASDPKKAVVFAAINDAIYIYHPFSIWQNSSAEFSVQFKGKSMAFGQIAFDYVSSNLYWCDSYLHWIAMKPAYNFNDSIYKVIVQKDLKQPEGLALDPEDRLMFFSDNDPNARIEKASLDGQDRVVIVYRGLLLVRALTVDTVNNKLYWADRLKQTIEGSDYDGSNRKVIKRFTGNSVSDLSYHQNKLHAISFLGKSVFAVDATSGFLLYSRKFLSEQPVAIAVYDAEFKGSFFNLCSTINCHHMCVNTQSGPKCLCSEGFDLDNNNKTCSEASPFFEKGFVVSNASMFAMHEVHTANGHSNRYNFRQIPNTFIESFAVDAKSCIIYFVDSGNSLIKKYSMISQKATTLATISSAKDLIFDWISNLLGWIEQKEFSIMAFSINSETTSSIYASLQNPASLTVDPHKRALYWISETQGRSIVRGSWTRDEPKVLISAEHLNEPSSLQYDVTSNRLYWLDQSLIKSSSPIGLDIKSHIDTNGAIKSFAYKNFFGWIYEDGLYFARKIVNRAEQGSTTLQNSKDVAVFDSSLQNDMRGTCYILNGGCEEICIPENNGRRCECDIGLQLQPDQTCDSDVLTSKFIAVTDFTHGRILQVEIKTGNVVKLPMFINKLNGLAFDKSTMTLFYSDFITKTITSTTLHGKNKTLFYEIGSAFAKNLAIDYSTGNLYYTAECPTRNKSYIGIVHRTTSLHKTLISDIFMPNDIALYPSKGYLFWTEFGDMTEIGRANMDGTSQLYFATTEIRLPHYLAIDYKSDRLYWTDAMKNSIESCDLNGGHHQILAYDSGGYLNDIVVNGRYLFYTAWHRSRIVKMDKLTGTEFDFMSDHPEFGLLESLDIYADDLRDVNPSCSVDNGLCSMFCFPSPTGRTCGCQDGLSLQSDQLTCEEGQETEVTEGTYLFAGSFAGVALFVVITIVGIVYMKKRRSTSRVSYERTSNTQDIGETNRYSIPRGPNQTINSMYDTIRDVYDEPIITPYLSPCV